jgi:hypothetical protein
MNKINRRILLITLVLSFAAASFGQDEKEFPKKCSVVLEVEFLKSGKTGKASVVSNSCGEDSGLEKKTVERAGELKFTPQMRDGQPVTVTKRVIFDVTISEEQKEERITNIEYENPADEQDLARAEAVIAKAVEKLGGEKYLNVKNSIGEGKFSVLKDGRIVSFQSFTDIIVYPETERTDFSGGNLKTVMVNTGDTGWIYDELFEKFGDQTKSQLENFRRSFRAHYNYLLRGDWKGNAELAYVERRPASLGKRNDVLKLTFPDGFAVEYEFSDDGLPMKTIYTVMNSENLPVTEENRFAQYILENGVFAPFVVDHFTDGVHTFRVNYQSMDYNRNIPNEIFVKPSDPKKLRKKLKL